VSALASVATAAEPVARAKIDFTRNQVRLPVSINGSEPFSLILDTGMPTRGVLLRPTPRVEALDLQYHSGSEASLSGGGSGPAVTARMAAAEHIKVGEYEIKEVPVIVLPTDAGLPRDVDGVIGAELFDRYVVRVDVDAAQLELFDFAAYQPPAGSTAVPIRLRERMPFVDARVTIGAHEVKADLAVDLGAGHAIWLNEGSNPQLAAPPGSIETTIGRGLSGPILGSIGRVPRVAIGDFAFEKVVGVFPVSEHQNPGGFDFKDGFVGAELLTRFIVTFDYDHERMLLERGARFGEPFEHDMTGMVLNPQGLDRRSVDSVLKGSPAEEAGVMEGDVLVAVDGQPLATLGMDALKRAFQRDGAEVVVTLERGSTTIEKRFKLRRLV
jgi:hypothetical protein